MGNILNFSLPVLAFLPAFLFFAAGIYFTLHYSENGVITRKAIFYSSASYLISGLRLVLFLVLMDDGRLLPRAVIALCLVLFSVIFYAIYHLFFLNVYIRRQQKGKTREIDRYLKDIFKH